MTDEQMEKMLAYLDSEEFKKDMDKMIKEEEEKIEKHKQFFETEEFNIIYNKIVDSGEDSIDGSGYIEQCITEKEFYDFFDSVCAVLDMKDEEDANFPTNFVEYKGLILKTVHGQGSVSFIEVTSKAKALKYQKNIEDF
tara:strand:- start:34528 stop:34944 length:417 start_codon:yes stop_codon:yes gene_type:complete